MSNKKKRSLLFVSHSTVRKSSKSNTACQGRGGGEGGGANIKEIMSEVVLHIKVQGKKSKLKKPAIKVFIIMIAVTKLTYQITWEVIALTTVLLTMQTVPYWKGIQPITKSTVKGKFNQGNQLQVKISTSRFASKCNIFHSALCYTLYYALLYYTIHYTMLHCTIALYYAFHKALQKPI